MIDTHFHIMRPDPREPDAGVEKLRASMKQFGITGGIAVQPSVYRYDNSYLLSVLREFPETLRGVGVVPTNIETKELDKLKKSGLIGLRLNMIDNPDQTTPPDSDFLDKLLDAGLFLQVHAKGNKLAKIIQSCVDKRLTLVVDHLGRPDPNLGFQQTGFKEVVEGATTGQVFIKLSAPFRFSPHVDSFQIALRFAQSALAQAPLSQFLVGTDWPFIRCDHPPFMEHIFHWFRELIPEEKDWRQVAVENAGKLSGLPG